MSVFPNNKRVLFFCITISICSCTENNNGKVEDLYNVTPIINYSVEKYFFHDTALFTEGFVFYKGQLYESSGSPNEIDFTNSCIGKYDFSKAEFKKLACLDKTKYFGEGITIIEDTLYQLTYTSQKGFKYNVSNFSKVKEFGYPNKEGWGITTDGTFLIMSDGTENLTYMESGSFVPVKTVAVTENGLRRDSLNELEYINGFIYANIWLTNYIVKIEPSTGNVVGKLDLTSIVNEAKLIKSTSAELNGIAYDSTLDNTYVTGKLWPKIYLIKFNKN